MGIISMLLQQTVLSAFVEEMGREAMEKGREMYDRAWERLERYL